MPVLTFCNESANNIDRGEIPRGKLQKEESQFGGEEEKNSAP